MRRPHSDMQALAPAPIPTYEEATSRPSSSQRTRGPAEISDDAERQGFLGQHAHRQQTHRQPTVESARNSMDSDLSIPEMVGDENEDRRHLEELDYMEPGASDETHSRQARLYHRTRIRNKFSQHLSNLSATLGAIRFPSFRRRYAPVAINNETEVPSEATPAATAPTWRSTFQVPENYRMSVPVFARLLALIMIVLFVWVLFAMDLFPGSFRRGGFAATAFEPESVRNFVQSNIDMPAIQHYVEHLSSFAHEAGSEGNYFMAKWLQEKWTELCELDTIDLTTYNILADYPVEDERWVKVLEPEGVDWSATWEEEVDHERPDRQLTLAWHGYSKSASVQGTLVAAGSGTRDDFDNLRKQGVNLTGSVALITIDGGDSSLDSALKIHYAQDAGCVGVLLAATGPGSSSDLPEGTAPGDDTVHRTNVALSNWVMGDPLTPGFASIDSNKQDPNDSPGLPAIPSLPISFRNAEKLRSLVSKRQSRRGHMHSRASTDVTVMLRNQNEEVQLQKIWNLHGIIQGAEYPDQRVIIGAPRDSWCFGASDSASASALLTGVIAVFGELLKLGWRPLRTMEFVSWDASTLNSGGSTEYVEEHIDKFRESVIAYFNLDSGFGGTFYAQGSPLMQRALQKAMNRVAAPGVNETMHDVFDSDEAIQSKVPITPLPLANADGDFGPFTYILGVPVLDIGFHGMPQNLVRGSCYDTMSWLDKFGDKREQTHQALLETWALSILNVVAAPLLPFNPQDYAERLGEMVRTFESEVRKYISVNGPTDSDVSLDFDPLKSAVDGLTANAIEFLSFESEWTANVMGRGGMESLHMNTKRAKYNARISAFEKAFLDIAKPGNEPAGSGLKDRPQFKHILYAPEKWSTGVRELPTIWEALEERRWDDVQPEIARVAGFIQRAGEALLAE